MSNFNYESFPGYEDRIICGPEVVNGTGQVSLKFYDCFAGESRADMVFFLMDYEETLRLAGWLADHAFEAMRQQWRDHHLLSG